MSDVETKRLAEIWVADKIYCSRSDCISSIETRPVIRGKVVDVSDFVASNTKFVIPFGNNVELVSYWIRNWYGRLSAESIAFIVKATKVKREQFLLDGTDDIKRIHSELRSFRKAGAGELIGSQIKSKPIVYSDVLTALRLVSGMHPLSKYLYDVMSKWMSINGIAFVSPHKVLELIDFPCTSVRNVLLALGMEYMSVPDAIERGIVTGKTYHPITPFIAWYNVSRPNYKMGEKEVLLQLYSAGALTQTLESDALTELGVVQV